MIYKFSIEHRTSHFKPSPNQPEFFVANKFSSQNLKLIISLGHVLFNLDHFATNYDQNWPCSDSALLLCLIIPTQQSKVGDKEKCEEIKLS